jgi:hypothetical protein
MSKTGGGEVTLRPYLLSLVDLTEPEVDSR